MRLLSRRSSLVVAGRHLDWNWFFSRSRKAKKSSFSFLSLLSLPPSRFLRRLRCTRKTA